ncbi:2,4-dienoyl-CoA reductase-like NADH-dependent reductase (Old Yellow Enzyme family) [Paenibacillus phyllosphaerae]|uniref:2,4-dienoyl-CoA reductase-like NADH-dependent reductase (Old Yellow Enzyme family) n=1 Tax=Paenibacillus phyllosphaerae TaxID=274593 RepID=A0A7W5FPF3_9BACL|nr:alkene reductase [Paenibacillus phyllosphaerae]MBB3112198.1 2,4-dienoyl-CoA reductase-like NADH-dependent reductase (Old Yellow Enzyme family) [Paenibacillus phyllosphaerae]
MGSNHKLLQPARIGAWQLRNRIAMAPMTRGFANDASGVVGEDVAAYYRRRAKDGIGLIITEGITPSPRGKGTFGVPGLYSMEQVKGWRSVTEAVHEEGGTIFAQLWHVGRLTHPDLTGGLAPQAPSALQATGLVHRLRKPFAPPEAMSPSEIREVVREYKQAAQHAVEAGFDGVELHGAHGYLIDQFATAVTNQRTDRYGGNRDGRLLLLKEILAAVGDVVAMDRVVVRFSELKDDLAHFRWEEPEAEVQVFLDVFRSAGLRVIHPSTNAFAKPLSGGDWTLHELVRKHWDGDIIGVGGLSADSASEAIRSGVIDVAAFGRPLLANPDFVQRLREGKPLAPYEPSVHLKHLR